MVRAAGGVVLRDGCVLLIHRRRHDDWSLPKGHVEAGETWEEAALREVWEETGLRCELGEYLGATHYVAPAEGDKEVRYWLMSSADEAVASNEVDAVRWVTPAEARGLMSYDTERELVETLEPGSTNQVPD